MTPAWLPTPFAWGSLDAADVAMIILTVAMTLVASAMPTARLVVAVLAIVVVLVGALTIAWAVSDLLAAVGRYRGVQ